MRIDILIGVRTDVRLKAANLAVLTEIVRIPRLKVRMTPSFCRSRRCRSLNIGSGMIKTKSRELISYVQWRLFKVLRLVTLTGNICAHIQ